MRRFNMFARNNPKRKTDKNPKKPNHECLFTNIKFFQHDSNLRKVLLWHPNENTFGKKYSTYTTANCLFVHTFET